MYIKEENLRDGHSRERRSDMDREQGRGMKETSDKKGGRETDREDHSMGDSSKEVRRYINISSIHSVVCCIGSHIS